MKATHEQVKPAVGYVRVSTERQASDGVSLDVQRERIAAWCVANDCELASVHVDAGLSGGRADNRPALQRALHEVRSTGGILVVYSLSRLARSTRDTLEIADQLDKAGADLVSLSEKIDTTSAAGRMLFRMLAVLSEFERDLVSERTTAALAYKRANGERLGGVPFGYQLAGDGVHLVPDETEQAIIRTIAELRHDGLSYRRIGQELHRRGLNPKSAERWHAKVIMEIFKRAA